MNGRKLLAAIALIVLLAPAPAYAGHQATSPPPSPTPSPTTTVTAAELTCTIRFSAWNGFFTASGTLGWTGSLPAPSWVVTFVLPGNMSVSQVWNGTYTQSGANVRLASPAWGGFVPLTFGFAGRYTGTFTPPADIRANGVPCTLMVG